LAPLRVAREADDGAGDAGCDASALARLRVGRLALEEAAAAATAASGASAAAAESRESPAAATPSSFA
jgi:hypothetical protein